MSDSEDRKEYKHEELSKSSVAKNPFEQFASWYSEAMSCEQLEANAMQLATADSSGMPSIRTILLRGLSDSGFRFFTNYLSNKGIDLEENPRAAICFFWDVLERQVRISGKVKKLSDQESDEYFSSRPRGAQISALVSNQSQEIENRIALDRLYKERALDFAGNEVPRPTSWGGYLLIPSRFEFWQGRPERLHDRIAYTLQQDESWKIHRLCP